MALRGIAGISNSSTNATITVNVVSIGIASGDVVLLCIQGGGSTSNTFTYPTGFTAITGLANHAVGSQSTQGIAMKVAGASEPSTYAVTSSSTDFESLVCRVYSGRSGTVTAAVATASNFGTSPVTMTLTGLTAAAGDDIVYFIATEDYQGTTPTYGPPSGFANGNVQFTATTFSPILLSCDNVGAAAGGTGTAGGVLTEGVLTGLAYSGFQLSLAQGSGGGGAPYLPYTPVQFFVTDTVIQT